MARRERFDLGGRGHDLERVGAEGRDGLRSGNSERRRPSRNGHHPHSGSCRTSYDSKAALVCLKQPIMFVWKSTSFISSIADLKYWLIQSNVIKHFLFTGRHRRQRDGYHLGKASSWSDSQTAKLCKANLCQISHRVGPHRWLFQLNVWKPYSS